MTRLDIFHNSLEFWFQARVEKVWMVNTGNRTVGWNWNHANVINFTEFFFFGFPVPVIPWQLLLLHTEEVLVSNRRRCFGFFLNWNTFFGFNRLVKSIRIATSFHGPTSKLVDDQDFFDLRWPHSPYQNHDVVGTKGIVDKVSQSYVFNIVTSFQD